MASWKNWIETVGTNSESFRANHGPTLVTVVSGGTSDHLYWQDRFQRTAADVFRIDGNVKIVSSHETTRKGNFLGTLKAWNDTKGRVQELGIAIPNISLMSMVFGQGTRLSPFTQSLGNRKPAFPTPLKGERSNTNIQIAELSNKCSLSLVKHLDASGFRGMLVKWGDEAIVPGKLWEKLQDGFSACDAIRFVWPTEIEDELATQKEWIISDSTSGLMTVEYSRQSAVALKARLSAAKHDSQQVGVNLGSFAISYAFLDILASVFSNDISAEGVWADWDPYVWIALYCDDVGSWRAEAERELQEGRSGIHDLEKRIPDFFIKVAEARRTLEAKNTRGFHCYALDFGEPFWIDMGSHQTLRKCMETLTSDSVRGRVTRALFQIPEDRDENGNIVLNSSLPATANITNSVIIDSTITNSSSVINNGVVVGCRYNTMHLPYGGVALFSAGDSIRFASTNGIAFRSLLSELEVPEGGRHTTLLLPTGPRHLVTNESLSDYSGDNYREPVFGNAISFQDAASEMSKLDASEVDENWLAAWKKWQLSM